MPTEPFGMTIFCDDIRQEVGGKITLVGCYRADMILSGVEFPVTLPKLGLAISYMEPMELDWKPIDLCIYFPGDQDGTPSIKGEIKGPLAKDVTHASDGQKNTLRVIKAEIMLGPVTITQPGRIRVRAHKDNKEISLGSLLVRRPDSPAVPEVSAVQTSKLPR